MRPNPFLPAWLLVTGLALPAVLPMASAATLYWDGTSTGPNADGGNGNWNSSSANTNWDKAATNGTDAAWVETNDAVFGGARGTVTVNTSVNVTSIDFKTGGYTITGGFLIFPDAVPQVTRVISNDNADVAIASSIIGSAPLAKSGSGHLTLSGPNSSFTGSLTISQGTARVASAAALGSVNGATIVTTGGSLDLDGRDVGLEPLRIQGAGAPQSGALVNFHQSDAATVRSLQLTGHAAVGGYGRMNIGNGGPFNMGGYTLTKYGQGALNLFNSSIFNPGNIDVSAGSLWMETAGVLRGTAANTITVRDGATLGLAGSSDITAAHPWSVILKDGATWKAASGPSMRDRAFWRGPVTLDKTATIDVGHAFTMTHRGSISGTGGLTKTGDGTWVLTSSNTYKGGTRVNGGKLILNRELSGDGSNPDPATLVGFIRVDSPGTLEIAQPGSLGGNGVPGVDTLWISRSRVENTSGGSNNLKALTLEGGTLRSAGTVNSPLTEGRFVMLPGGVVKTLSADNPSYIHGRLDLAGSDTLPFETASGQIIHDLMVNAAITESVPGRGIDKSGAGRMVLNGASLFTGATGVHGGTLLIGGEGSLPHSPVTVHTGGSFGTATPGMTFTSLRAEEGSRLILPASAGATTTITGELDLPAGNFTVAPVLGAESVTGTYDLATAGAITGTGTPVLDLSALHGPTRATGSVSVVGNKLQLQLTATGADLVWNNASAGGAADGFWGMTQENFSLDGNNTSFQAFDSVTFNDSVAYGSNRTISLGPELAPARVTVDNSNGAYVFTGGSLVGGGSLVKRGSGQLVIEGTDNYTMTGGVTAGGGYLDFTGKHISIGKLTVENGGELHSATVHPTSMDLRSGTVGATLTGPAPWTKTTPGNVLLTENNSLTGPGTVSEGSVIVGSEIGNGPSGSLGSGPLDIANGASVDIRRYNSLSIENALSGAGQLGLTGNGEFSLAADNSSFSGRFNLMNARLAVSSSASLGTASVYVTGDSSLRVDGAVVGNAIRLSPSLPGVSSHHLVLHKTELAGPIELASGSTSYIKSEGAGSPTIDNVISGAITATRDPVSLFLDTGNVPGGSTLILSGASQYTGDTVIRGFGVTRLDGSLGGSRVLVQSHAWLGGSGSIHTGGSLEFETVSGLVANLSGHPLRVEGDVNLGDSLKVKVDIADAATVPGPIPLLEYTGTLSGDTAQVTLAGASDHRKALFKFTPGLITLDIGRKTVVWKATEGLGWEVGGTVPGWRDEQTGDDEFFYKGDSVIFEETTLAGVHNSEPMEPSAVLFDNAVGSMSFHGAGVTGSCALTKRGSGSVILRFQSSNTGGTFIEAGKVDAGMGSLGTGPVVVSAGGTLTGGVDFPGALTVLGTLDPGIESGELPATITAGPTVLSGTYRCELGEGANDRLDVNGDLDITGANLVVEKDYASLVDFQGHFVIASWTGNLTGSFATVTGLPEGFELGYDMVNKRILARPLEFESWMADYPGLSDSSEEGDPDGDGIPNLVEFFLAGDPSSADNSILPKLSFPGDGSLLVSFKRHDMAAHSTLPVLQYSTDLDGNWSEVWLGEGGEQQFELIGENGDDPDDIAVRIHGATEKMFVRVKVSRK